jgi:CRP-like cAMP-binding protein
MSGTSVSQAQAQAQAQGHASSNAKPLDRALAFHLAGDHASALRLAAAVLARDSESASAFIQTARFLTELNAAADPIAKAFEAGAARAIASGNMALAVVAAQELARLGQAPACEKILDAVAITFALGGARLSTEHDALPPPLSQTAATPFVSLPETLSEAPLLEKVYEILAAAASAPVQAATPIVPIPFFSALSRADLRAVLGSFQVMFAAENAPVLSEGAEGAEAYIVAYGELEVRKGSFLGGADDAEATIGRLTRGALFGEMALLARAPRVASVVAVRPSILLMAQRTALEAVAQRRSNVAAELAAYCRRRMMANLVQTSPLLLAIPAAERAMVVERFKMRIFEKSDTIIVQDAESDGVHLIASGEVAVMRRDGDESLVLSTLRSGHVIGEVALVLRRKASAHVVAVHPTITLHLPQQDFMSMVKEHPDVLHGLYLLAVERDLETSLAIANSTMLVGDDVLL